MVFRPSVTNLERSAETGVRGARLIHGSSNALVYRLSQVLSRHDGSLYVVVHHNADPGPTASAAGDRCKRCAAYRTARRHRDRGARAAPARRRRVRSSATHRRAEIREVVRASCRLVSAGIAEWPEFAINSGYRATVSDGVSPSAVAIY